MTKDAEIARVLEQMEVLVKETQRLIKEHEQARQQFAELHKQLEKLRGGVLPSRKK